MEVMDEKKIAQNMAIKNAPGHNAWSIKTWFAKVHIEELLYTSIIMMNWNRDFTPDLPDLVCV